MAGRSKIDAWRGQIRIPRQIADWLQSKADSNFRSLNAEIVETIRRAKETESVKAVATGQGEAQ
jgi:hypothetical protein